MAVAAVVLSHAGVGPPAGFVGVDVFFVISGYLITALLLREYELTGRLDLPGFYARRVRRILPAAVVIICCTLVAGAALLSVVELRELARSAAASLVFSANLFFQHSADGYFRPDATRIPLLHMWSLSVEEQFYGLWPLLLLGLMRWRGRLAAAMLGVSVLSLGLSEWFLRLDADAAFFQMPARFWELALGGLVVVAPTRRWGGGVVWAGLAVVVASTLVSSHHFPGLGALPAVMGTALILVGIRGGAENRLLASRALVGLGLVSYSLYLWHWPILALYRGTIVGQGSPTVLWGLCAASVGMALASYRYVEQPFRHARFPAGRTLAWGIGISVLLAAGLAWLASPATDPHRVAEASTPASRAAADLDAAFIQRCEYRLLEPLSEFPKASCPPQADSRLVIWGDSMAAAWEPMIAARDSRASAFVRSGCPPLLGYRVTFRARVIADLCSGFNARVVDVAHGDTLVLAARWQAYEGMEPSLRETLRQVSPRFRRVLVLGMTPELKSPAPRCIQFPKAGACGFSRAEFEDAIDPLRIRLKAVAGQFKNVEYVETTDFFCPMGECPVSRDGYSLYTDLYHVSASAARAFGEGLGSRL